MSDDASQQVLALGRFVNFRGCYAHFISKPSAAEERVLQGIRVADLPNL
jgi:hypothetical protein